MAEPSTADEWAELLERPLTNRAYFKDSEAVKLTGMGIRHLRRLQSTSLISAKKIPKKNGGFIRVWDGISISKAAVAGDLNYFVKWDISLCGEILCHIPENAWFNIIDDAEKSVVDDEELLSENGDMYVHSLPGDWEFRIYGNSTVAIYPGAREKEAKEKYGISEYTFGIINRNGEGFISFDEDDDGSKIKLKFFNSIHDSGKDRHSYVSMLNMSVPVRRLFRRRAGLYAIRIGEE